MTIEVIIRFTIDTQQGVNYTIVCILFNMHYIQIVTQNEGFPIWQLEKNVFFFPIWQLEKNVIFFFQLCSSSTCSFFLFADILFFYVFPKVICSISSNWCRTSRQLFRCYSMLLISIKGLFIMSKSMINWQKSKMTHVIPFSSVL